MPSAIFGIAILFAANGLAQQEGARSGPAPAPAPAAAPVAGTSSDATERERLLLERIEKLERRLAQIESGAAVKPAPEPPAPSTQSAPLAVPAPEQIQVVAVPAKEAPGKAEPFAFADFTWLTGNSRQKEFPLAGKVFSGEFRVDRLHVLLQPARATTRIGGSTEIFRHNEVRLTDLAFGGDFNCRTCADGS